MTFWKWSQTANSNSTADSTINWAEGQAPSSVNDSARAMMAAAAKYRDDVSGNIATGGSSTAYTVSTSQNLTTLTDGFKVTARMHATSGATPTLAVDGLDAKQIRSVYGTNVPTGALLINSVWSFTYDSTDEAWIAHGQPGGTVPVSATTLTASGAATLSSTLAVTGNVTVNTDKFAVTAASGNTAVGGTLAVTGASTLTGATTVTGALTANNSAGVTAYNTAKAYAFFTVSGNTVSFTAGNYFNVASIVRADEGQFTITFSTALPTANYVVVGTGIEDASTGSLVAVPVSRETTGFSLRTYLPSESLSDPSTFGFVVFGF